MENHENNIMVATVRKSQPNHPDGRRITLPITFVRAHDLQPGDVVVLSFKQKIVSDD